MPLRLLLALATALAIVGCGSAVAPPDGADVSPLDVAPDESSRPDVPPPPDVVDATPDESFPDAPPTMDVAPDAPPDVPTMDVPPTMDVAPDAPACMGVADTCATAEGCPNLAGAMMRPVSFAGATANYMLSCAPSGGAAAPDVAVPLVVPTFSDVEVVVTPTGSSAAQVAIFRAADCAPASEVRCAATAGFGGGEARVRVSDLPPGRYFVVIRVAGGNPAFVSATLTPGTMRPPGDRCPGVVETPDDGAFTALTASPMTFSPDPDVGTACGSGARTTGFVDTVFQYTIASTRDVTIDVRSTGTGQIAVEAFATCGARASAVTACTTSFTNSVTRLIRSQPPGTYYVVVEWPVFAMSPARTATVEVRTAPPSMGPTADVCPGLPVMPGVAARAPVAGLSRDFTLACMAGATMAVDAAFAFTAPPATQDVIVSVRNTDVTPRALAVELRAGCPGTPVGPCLSGGFRANSSVFRRYGGLSAGAAHTIIAQSQATSGDIEATYWTVPAATRTAVMGNDACSPAPPVIRAPGGVFAGETASAMSNFDPPGGCGCGTGTRDVVYRLEVATRSRVLASLTAEGANWDTLLYIRSGADCATATSSPMLCNDDLVGLNSGLDVTLDPGTYWVVVDGCFGSAAGSYVLDVAMVPPST